LQEIIQYIEDLHFSEDDIEYLRSQHKYNDDFLDYLKTFKFHGDIYAFEEGTIMYPNEPIITVVADLIEAQIVETAILAQVNHQSLIATKASRIVRAAAGRPVTDFGARRAHNYDAATLGARAAYIGGVVGTATVSAGKEFGIPIGGTMAHSYVMFYQDELTAFRTFAKDYPNNCTLLVDTYNVLKSGVPNAIKVFQEMKDAGIQGKIGIRIDSGDLAYLSKASRAMLDDAGFPEAKIVVSNSLDEFTINSLLLQGAKIDSFGVGERLITAKSDPVFGAVYKLVAVEENGEWQPRIKISETVAKITNPGLKRVYRVYDEMGAIADVIAGDKEKVEGEITVINPEEPWKRYTLTGRIRELQVPIFRNGKLVYECPDIQTIKKHVAEEFANQWETEQRFYNPHKHYMDMTLDYYNMKISLLEKEQL
ncbi:MAG: nicotinate phosphoribosyltransferase, partial [Erysipelotrichaceae bacterium]|nr:nicotinate phosphoribosyltransferase [Erysipelotrichaceae bacterium]